MKHTQNLHTHTIFDDGRAAPMDMARAAVDAGLTSLGFSAHSPMPYENDWAITVDRLPAYRAELDRVRETFRGHLTVYEGLEWDGASSIEPTGFDYIIGSLHLISPGQEDASIDYTPNITRHILYTRFSGDEHAMIRAYFDQYAAMAANPHVDIVGHFDLLTKFSEHHGLFPAHDPYLLEQAQAAMEPLVRAGKIFEVNTGAISRGLRSEPYPSVPLLHRLCELGGRVTISSDAHGPELIAHSFDAMEALLRTIGFRETWVFDGTSFVPSPL